MQLAAEKQFSHFHYAWMRARTRLRCATLFEREQTVWCVCMALFYLCTIFYQLALHDTINEAFVAFAHDDGGGSREARMSRFPSSLNLCGIKKFLHFIFITSSESCYWNVCAGVCVSVCIHLIKGRAIQDTTKSYRANKLRFRFSLLLHILIASFYICCCCCSFIDHNGVEHMNSTNRSNTFHAFAICSLQSVKDCMHKKKNASNWAKYVVFYRLCNVPIKSCDGKKRKKKYPHAKRICTEHEKRKRKIPPKKFSKKY